jgi:thymidylate kinase
VFYLDVPLEESLQRHEGRTLRAEVEPEAVASWYQDRDTLDLPGEVVLDTSTGADAVLDQVRGLIGPVEQLRQEPEGVHVHRWLGTTG